MNYTNNMNLPTAFYKAVARDYQYKPHRYSVTSLEKGALEQYLLRTYDGTLTQDVSDMLWLVFGTAVHKVLEDNAEDGTAEQKIEYPFTIEDGNDKFDVTISGVFDVYEKKGVIEDYKTVSVYKCLNDSWDDYKEQLTGYAYLMRKTKGEEIHRGRIIAFIKDWSKADMRRTYNYPLNQVYVVEFDITDEMMDAWFEKMKRKILVLERAFKDSVAPEPCTAEERWERPKTYAVKKKKEDLKAMKLFKTLEEAEEYSKDGAYQGNVIEIRPAVSPKCEDYCVCNGCCKFYQDYLESKGNVEYKEKIHKHGEKVEKSEKEEAR